MTLPESNILYFALCFLVGAIPFSVIIGKLFFGIDVRRQGSGNPGATNTLRLLGKRAALSVLALDMAKGLIPTLLAPHFVRAANLRQEEIQAIAGACAILGHVFSPFLRFKGGKGVATSIGVIIAINWLLALALVLLFVIVVYLTRYISLGSLAAAFLFAVLEIIHAPYSTTMIIFSIGLAVLIAIKHKANIRRLLSGSENKFAW